MKPGARLQGPETLNHEHCITTLQLCVVNPEPCTHQDGDEEAARQQQHEAGGEAGLRHVVHGHELGDGDPAGGVVVVGGDSGLVLIAGR